jgi:hypothetical protein
MVASFVYRALTIEGAPTAGRQRSPDVIPHGHCSQPPLAFNQRNRACQLQIDHHLHMPLKLKGLWCKLVHRHIGAEMRAAGTDLFKGGISTTRSLSCVSGCISSIS